MLFTQCVPLRHGAVALHAAPQPEGGIDSVQMFGALLGELQLQPATCAATITTKTNSPERSVAVIPEE
jgi:hypothetical protein